MIFLWLWRLQTKLDWDDVSPDTLQVLLDSFAFMTWSTTLKSTLLSLLDFAWFLRFLKTDKKFFNPFVLWSIVPLPFSQQFFIGWFQVLRLSWNL